MAKTKEEKKEIIKELTDYFKEKKSLVFIDFKGLDADNLFKMRNELKDNGCLLKVIKRTLCALVFESSGAKEIKEKLNKMEGQIALVFGFQDEITALKIIHKFSQNNENIKILGGVFADSFAEQSKVIEMAQLPSREELLGKLVAVFNSPCYGFVNALKGNLRNFVFLLSKRSTQ
jgi:large subunit ribosomal protein L10